MDRKDEIILQQMDLIRSMTERNLRSMDTDFWGTPLMGKKTNQPPISEKSEKPASQTQAAKPEEKEEIAENAHDPGQSTHGGAHFGVAGLVGVFNKETQQKMCHNPASYRKSVYFTIDFRKKKGHFSFESSEKPPGYQNTVSGRGNADDVTSQAPYPD